MIKKLFKRLWFRYKCWYCGECCNIGLHPKAIVCSLKCYRGWKNLEDYSSKKEHEYIINPDHPDSKHIKVLKKGKDITDRVTGVRLTSIKE
tara:strand:- start:1300 stop:1572 length:273 start_codon:yes stop_codon:yes gene_type:complete